MFYYFGFYFKVSILFLKVFPEFRIIELETPTSNMPRNILDQAVSTSQELKAQLETDTDENLTKEDQINENITKKWLFRRQASSTTLTDSQQDTRIKAKKKPIKQNRHPSDHNLSSPHAKFLSTSTAKKRTAIDPIDALIGENSGGLNEPRTPVSKRRLIIGENLLNSPCSPRPSASCIDSPARTILHYFSPKPPQK